MSKLELHLAEWPRWMSIEIAAAYMCRSKKYVEMLIRTGNLPAIRSKVRKSDGSTIYADTRLDREKIDQYMKSGEHDFNKIKHSILKKLNDN
ncbi:MAG: hypothetical protein KDH98_08945 [Calditrichaeota bacterium]|nr:hypothetical protein [Calditrichota bacterium]